MNFRKLKTLIIVFLQGCACEFSSLDRITQIKTPYEKMIAEQEHERQKKEAKPIIVSETLPENLKPQLVSTTEVTELVSQIDYSVYPVNGESDKQTAGELSSVFFDFNWQTLNKNQKLILKQNAQELIRYPRVSVILSAHSDSLGNQSYNKNLSRNRAINVYKYLVSLGVPENRMSIKVAGNADPLTEIEFKPIKSKSDLDFYKKALSQNRRVNFIVDSIRGINDIERNILISKDGIRELQIKEEVSRNIATIINPIIKSDKGFESIYFKPNTTNFEPEDQKNLDKNIQEFKLKANHMLNVTVYVKGTSPEKIQSNMKLSADRAKKIFSYFVDKGISEDQFNIKIAKVDDSKNSSISNPKDFRGVAFSTTELHHEPIYSPVEASPSPVTKPLEVIKVASKEIESEKQVTETALNPEKPESKVLTLFFESKKNHLTSDDEQNLTNILKKYEALQNVNIVFTLNTKGKNNQTISINQKLTNARISYLKKFLNKNFNSSFVDLKPDLAPVKSNLNYRSLTVKIDSIQAPLETIPNKLADAPTETERKISSLQSVDAPALENTNFNFESKKSNLEKNSLIKLNELLSVNNKTNQMLRFELYIKGKKPSDISINTRLAEKRKKTILDLLAKNNIDSKNVNIDLIKIDLEKNISGAINYRKLSLFIKPTMTTEVATESKPQQNSPTQINLNPSELVKLENEISSDVKSIGDILAKESEDLTPKNELNIQAPTLSFISKKNILTPESLLDLKSYLTNYANSGTPLTFTLFVKGSRPSIYRINERLTLKRKNYILAELRKSKFETSKVVFNIVYPDRDNIDGQFNGNYRLCIVNGPSTIKTPLKTVVESRGISSEDEDQKVIKEKPKSKKKKIKKNKKHKKRFKLKRKNPRVI